jgi:hypothetical protein
MNLEVCTRSSWSAASGILLSKSVSHHERQATAAWKVTVRYGTWLLIDSPQLAVKGAQDQVMLYLLGCFWSHCPTLSQHCEGSFGWFSYLIGYSHSTGPRR